MRVLWITLAVVVVDQATKIIVLNTMMRHESIPLLGDWLRLTFTENPGMAFGITFGPPALVTIFSIIATLLIVLYMVRIGNRGYFPYRASLALILGGALGNIIDRVFYGVLLGYDGFFLGKVVDFIHVNLWRGYVPEAVPIIGGNYVALFPIWNVADMAIVVGVVGILVFQKTFHARLAAQHEAGAHGEGPPAEAGTAVPPSAEADDVPVGANGTPTDRTTTPGPPDEAAG
ncbi:MAG: lipoprotein signal peptidase [Rhodothermaceae bacterium]|nr:MAG: peptidase A8 [Bacteroidota bacterium]GIV61703.1 MAG: lipoprotein signal peptidase [Rhodothermaceae bacterium]